MATSKKKKKLHPVAVAFGAALRTARTKAGKTQMRLGLDCGLDRTYISLLECAVNQPTLGTVLLLAEELDTTPEALVTATRQLLSKARQRQFQHPTTSRGIKAMAKPTRNRGTAAGRGPALPAAGTGTRKAHPKSRTRSS